jgi:putative beta-lysine N-acetyltransferase
MSKTLLSSLSHDKANDRVYLMHLHPDDFPQIVRQIDSLARKYMYGKVFAKIPARYFPTFQKSGYVIEAVVPGLFGEDDGLFLSKYHVTARSFPEHEAMLVLQTLLFAEKHPIQETLDNRFSIRPLIPADSAEMARVFSAVFASYPFPITNPGFLRKTMSNGHTQYVGVFEGTKLVALSSAEVDPIHKNAEMTDFAILPSHRGEKLAAHLLKWMENRLTEQGIRTFYTIARLHEPAMNKTFLNQDYRYAGTLIRNTQIAGRIESMNVWYKTV